MMTRYRPWWTAEPVDPGFRIVGRCGVCGGLVTQATTWTSTTTISTAPPPQCLRCRLLWPVTT